MKIPGDLLRYSDGLKKMLSVRNGPDRKILTEEYFLGETEEVLEQELLRQ